MAIFQIAQAGFRLLGLRPICVTQLGTGEVGSPQWAEGLVGEWGLRGGVGRVEGGEAAGVVAEGRPGFDELGDDQRERAFDAVLRGGAGGVVCRAVGVGAGDGVDSLKERETGADEGALGGLLRGLDAQERRGGGLRLDPLGGRGEAERAAAVEDSLNGGDGDRVERVAGRRGELKSAPERALGDREARPGPDGDDDLLDDRDGTDRGVGWGYGHWGVESLWSARGTASAGAVRGVLM